jgi:putative hemolysin
MLLQSGLLVILLVCSAFCSSSEVALFSLNPLHLRRLTLTHPKATQRIEHLLNPPTRLLSTILITNTLVNVLIAIVGYALVERMFPGQGEWITIVFVTLLLLIFGEVGPKRIAMLWPAHLAVWFSGPLTLVMVALTPLRAGLEKLTGLFRSAFQTRGRTLTEDEFETVVELSGERGVLQENERQMVKAIMRLEELRASDVMTPRVDLVGVDLHDRNADVLATALHTRTRQIVLYRDSIDQIESLLDTRRFLLDPGQRVQAARVPPLYVPEACKLDQLLARFLREHRRAAIVVDEYGGTAGLVTRGDILEEIIGEIDDEHTAQKRWFDPAGPDRWLVDGQASLEDIHSNLGLDLESEDGDRLAGWITEQLERLPRPGDVVEAQGCRAVVQKMRKNRITHVLLEKLPEPEKEDEA